MRDRCPRSVPGAYVVEDRPGHPGIVLLQRVSRGDDPRRKPPTDPGDACEVARGRPVEIQARPREARGHPGGLSTVVAGSSQRAAPLRGRGRRER